MKREDITMFFLWMMIELRFSTLKFKFSMSWGSCTLIQVDGDSGAIDFGMLELWLALIIGYTMHEQSQLHQENVSVQCTFCLTIIFLLSR
jgi:hypothetical protein